MKHSLLRRAFAGVMGLFIASSSLVAVVEATAVHADAATTGLIKICKNFATPLPAGLNLNVTTATFGFTVSGITSGPGSSSENPLYVTVGSCSAVTTVPTGSEVITEVGAPWFTVGSITELAGQSYLTSSSLSSGSATVAVTATTNVDVVTYTNDPVTGYMEVCKQATAGSGLTGTYAFSVTGPDGFSNTTAAAAVGINNCSDPILVPAGTDTVTETGTNLYVTGIIANTNGVTGNDIVSDSTTTGTAVVKVAASSSTDLQTDVTYTNDVVNFETCKNYDTSAATGNGPEPGGATTKFPFTFTASGAAGPNGAPPALTPGLEAGQCSAPTPLRPGTIVSVAEGIVPGTKVESIVATGADSVSTPASVTAGTISVIVGTPTTSPSLPTNEAIVTYTDVTADPGTLKICKVAGTPAPTGTSFTFTVSGAPGTTTVAPGYCSWVENASGTPMTFPFNSTQTITETTAGANVSSITASPTNVWELVGNTTTPPVAGVSTQTSEPSLASSSGTIANVVIGELTTTEVYYTDSGTATTTTTTVPASTTTTVPGSTTTTAPSSTTTTVSTGGGGTTTTTVAPTTTTTSTTSTTTTTLVAAPSVSSTPAVAAGASKLTASQIKALLKHDKALLKTANLRVAAEKIVVAHTKGAKHKAAVKKLASLVAKRNSLERAIRAL